MGVRNGEGLGTDTIALFPENCNVFCLNKRKSEQMDGWMSTKGRFFLVHAKMSFKLDSKVGREENPKVSREQ